MRPPIQFLRRLARNRALAPASQSFNIRPMDSRPVWGRAPHRVRSHMSRQAKLREKAVSAGVTPLPKAPRHATFATLVFVNGFLR